MKFTIAEMALTVLGLASLGFAAPATDGISGASEQLSGRLEPACIDMWQDVGRQTPIRLNVSKPLDLLASSTDLL